MEKNEILDKTKKLYEDLLDCTYSFNGAKRTIYQGLIDRSDKDKLTLSHAYCGSKYFDKDTKHKIMVVGRAMNGWLTFSNEDTKTDVIEMLFAEDKCDNKEKGPKPFCDVVNSCGNWYKDENGVQKLYFYARSSFWRLIRNLLVQFGEEEKAPDCFYSHKKDWHQKIVWSNLYKVSPASSGNPTNDLIRSQIDKCVEILKTEIELYKPEYILFVTDYWYLKPSKSKNDDKEYFMELIGDYRKCSSEYIIGKQNKESHKIVICKRPERRDTIKMAEDIYNAFTDGEGR